MGRLTTPRTWEEYYGSFIGLTPKKFFPALGNHDLDDVCGLDCNTGYLNYFGPTLPGSGVTTTNTSGSNNYYDFVEGPVHFFVLDTEHISSTSNPNTSGAQYLWLQAQLPASTSLYNVVIVPQTPYSSSAQHTGVGPDGGSSLEYLQWPFEDWGATAVFSGDEHLYERVMRDDNADSTDLPYIVTGNGGRVLSSFGTPIAGSQVRLTQFGAVIATADGSGITFDERTVGGGSLGTLSDTVTVDAPTPPWTSYIDTIEGGGGSAANVLTLTPPNGTTCSAPCDPYPSTDTFTLKDFSDGSPLTGIQMQVDANVDVVSNNPTSDPFTTARGDESSVFGGIVSAQGAYSFTSTAGHKFDLNFTGLDDSKTYTVVVGSDRFDGSGSNQYRWSQFQLTGAGSFTQPATTIGTAYIVGDGGASVAFNTGNNTDGYVARWTNVTPVGGAFSVVTNYFAAPTGTTNASSYPPSAVMLAEEGPAGPSAPGAPTGVTAVAGDTTADVSWTAPAYDGGSAITGYVVTPYIDSTPQAATNVGVVTAKTITGLINDTAYTFKVAAKNTNGTGPDSAASNSVIPQVPPVWTSYIDTIEGGGGSAANVLTLTPPNGTTCSAPCDPYPSTDTFTLKDFSDGSPLTGIQMQVDANVDVVSNNPTSDPFTTARGDESSVFGGIVSAQGAYSFTSTAGHKFDLNFTGLDDSKTYTVVVGSDRFDGSGSNQYRWSQFQLTGAGSFTQPATTIGTAYIVGDGGASVAFNTGNNTDGYVARWTNVTPVGGAFSVVTNYFAAPTGTTNASSYPPSAVMLAEEGPAGPSAPGAPTGVTAVAGDTTADVSWTAPAYDGGSAITGYQVTPYIGATAGTPVLVGSAATAKTITGLTNGTAYTFKVAAINTNGTGPDSAASNEVTPHAPLDNWTAYADLRTSSNSNNNAANVLEIPGAAIDTYGTGSPINPATSFTLTDLATGLDTDARLQVDNSGLYISSENGTSFSAGPAFDVFGGIVDGAGVFSEQTGAVFQINLTGLDPAKRYTVVATSNRNQDPANRNSDPSGDERWTDIELVGADSATEASDGTTTVVSPTHVRFGSENNTARGDYGRWTDIDPGADGAFSIKTNVYLNGDADRSYVPVQLMLQETTPLASASNLFGHFSAGGADQAGGAVYVFSADAYVYVGAATADGSGDYSIDLAPGDYKLYLGPVSAGYGLQWYGGSGDWDTAIPITVSGATVEDIALPPLASASNLSGHFSAGGADQAGGAVYVFSADAYVYVGAATADGSGDYSIDLAPGDYKLYLGPVSAGYGLQWYGGSGDWDTAIPITVSGATTEDIALPPLASASNLSGHFSAGGADQAGGAVYVFSADAYVYVGAATADGSGDYSIDLAPGDYKLYLGPVSAGYGLQWYGGSGDWDTATPITVSGATTEDIALPPLASASNLSGHFSAGGADQAGGAVYVFSADAYVYVGAATADGSGDYSIDLAPGDYKLYLGPVSAGYGLQWYGGSGDWDTATPITVSGATTEDIALPPLASASSLSGHFSAGGADQAGGAVYVFSADAYVYVGAATADGSGDYSIDLAPGDYKLYLGPVSAGYGLQWYGGSGDWDTATPITVSGATTEDIALP